MSRAHGIVLAGLTVGMMGCAASGVPCVTGTAVQISPSTGTADHAAAAPGNQVKFTDTSGISLLQGSCPIPLIVGSNNAAWTSSDPLDVTVSSALGDTNGTATCVNATLTPATLTATITMGSQPGSKSVTISCK